MLCVWHLCGVYTHVLTWPLTTEGILHTNLNQSFNLKKVLTHQHWSWRTTKLSKLWVHPRAEHSTSGTVLSVVVMEMTDVTAGGKTSREYYGVFSTVVWQVERHLIFSVFAVCFTDVSPGNHHLYMWECPHQHFAQHTGRTRLIPAVQQTSARSRHWTPHGAHLYSAVLLSLFFSANSTQRRGFSERVICWHVYSRGRPQKCLDYSTIYWN